MAEPSDSKTLFEYAMKSRAQGFTANADALFRQIIRDYPDSPEATEAERYLRRGDEPAS